MHASSPFGAPLYILSTSGVIHVTLLNFEHSLLQLGAFRDSAAQVSRISPSHLIA